MTRLLVNLRGQCFWEPKHTGMPASGRSGAQGSGSNGSCRLTTTFAMIRVCASGAAGGGTRAKPAEGRRGTYSKLLMAIKNCAIFPDTHHHCVGGGL